jgi:hypothetical protein
LTFQANVRDQLQKLLAQAQEDEIGQLNNALRLLSKWRSVLLQNTVLQKHGTKVWQGPLAGLDFVAKSTEGCLVAKLLGCYEQPLFSFLEDVIASQYATLVNIGCSEGYYAVGLARRMPNTIVHAFDINPIAQDTCRHLAEKNGVAARVQVGALFSPSDFAKYAGQHVLVLCDIEGAEREMLDPVANPALKGMDLIVESHECFVPGITKVLVERFQTSHDITLVQDNGQRSLTNAPAWFNNLAHLDQLLAAWEWRSGPTPWLIMKSKASKHLISAIALERKAP